MAQCSNCGVEISFLRRSRGLSLCVDCAAAEKTSQAESKAQFQQWLDWAAFGPEDLQKATDAIRTLAPLTGLSVSQLARLKGDAFRQYAGRILADGILSESEEAKIQDVARVLEVSQDDLDTRFPGLMNELVVARVNDGRLPETESTELIVQRDEIVHGETPAALLKEVTLREFRGGYQGVSVPLGHGFRYRVGAGRGHSVTLGTELQVADSGVLVATSKRAVFIGSRKTLEFKLAKLVSLQVFQDGIQLSVSNRQNASMLRIPPDAVDAISSIIGRAAERVAAATA